MLHSTPTPSTAQQALLAQFQTVCDLDKSLFWIAKDEAPTIDESILQQLDLLAAQIHVRNPQDPIDTICRINHFLFHEQGFCGDREDYYHPQNSLLHIVLQRRKGLPILLAVVYMEIAKRLGLTIHGIGFPHHFLIQPVLEQQIFIDPFDNGTILSEMDLLQWHEEWGIELPFSACIRPTSPQEIVLRVCNNLFHAHHRLNHCEGMLRAIDRLLLLQPEMTTLYRTRSIILGRLKRYGEAINSLQLYMLHHPNATDISDCQRDLELLKEVSQTG